MKRIIARTALALSLLVPVYFAVAALGVKFGLFDWRFGLGVLLVQWGPRLVIGALAIAVVALLVVLATRPRRGWVGAGVAVLIPALTLGYLGWVKQRSEAIPPIHDVSTNFEDAPQFSPAMMAARTMTSNANPVVSLTVPISTLEKYQGPRFDDMADQSLGQVAREAYPDVMPLTVSVPPAAAFAAALQEAESRGWTIVTRDAATGVLEATAESFWFGFRDDLAVRVRPGPGGGSVIDARSVSRVGLSDLGANAARIEAYLNGVSRRL